MEDLIKALKSLKIPENVYDIRVSHERINIHVETIPRPCKSIIIDGWKHYKTIIDGVEFTACEKAAPPEWSDEADVRHV